MPEYRLSRLARLDLIEISDYTQDTWGVQQADRYIDGFEGCFRRLTQNPESGRRCNHIERGLRRIEHEKHVIFYRSEDDGIFVIRILHQRMMPKLREFAEP